ncbi:hypothetical protein TNCV_3622941 [Trichonephila clavipes]|nr:hypothetical protein TNCV_3622941 [Trichonephila clavipes]
MARDYTSSSNQPRNVQSSLLAGLIKTDWLRLALIFINPMETSRKIPKLANMVAKDAKLASHLISKNDVNLALPPRFR